ncbi:MAG: hypothetical protein JW860_12995 [Sedimentisphaerales bacterium]|nr:hypothetical protein [Sedimentisphaerales bacterium]
MLGDFEGGMDDWIVDSSATAAFSTEGVTHGAYSLEVTFPSGWIGVLKKDMRSQVEVLQTMAYFNLDVTTRNDGGQIPGGLSLFFIINSETGGWQQFDLSYPGVPSSPRTDTLTVTIPQSVRDTFILNGAGNWAEFLIITNSDGGGIVWLDNINAATPETGNVTIDVNADSPIRTIPMTLYGGNLQAWDGVQDGTNSTFNNLMIASGRKYLRIPGGSWGNGHLWNDIEGPSGAATWKVSYDETLYLLSQLSQPGEDVSPTLQPIVNFPGWWYETLQDDTPGDDDNQNYEVAHTNAVDAAVAWVADQSARTPTAQYWEIGNEIGGPWEVGWFEGISGAFYGDYFADFVLGMKIVNPNIKIGACAEPKHELQPWGWYEGYWTYDTLVTAFLKGVVPDFLIIHAYPGSGSEASYNPTLLSTDINNIGIYTSNMDGIITNAIGSQYVDQIRYWMTEWDSGGHDDYDRVTCYVNALFHAQYILEMARYNWEGSNPWIPDYGSGFWVYPVWYVNPLLIHYFGRDMVDATSSNSPLVRAYAATDADDNLTIFIVNNSPTTSFTADVDISGFPAGAGGQQWLVEPAGSMIAGGVNIQDMDNISINGVVHPDPLTAPALPSQPFTAGTMFTIDLPASCMMLLKIPAYTGDVTPPSAPTDLTATLDSFNNIELDWDENTEGDLSGYNVYRSTTSGSGYFKLNGSLLVDSEYSDTSVVGGEAYYYVVTAVDTSWNESDNSNEQSIAIPNTALGTILREWWTGISGAAVSNLTSNANYPDNPSGSEQLTSFDGPVNWTENYGTRIRGYLYPPTTGDYTFWIAGDDNCELWLSTDGTSANAVLIANVPVWTNHLEWDRYSQQESSPISLTAGQKYYIEVLHKEYTGGDNIAVAWSGPGISQEVIDGEYLSPWLTGLYGDFTDNGTVDVADLAEFVDLWLLNNCALTSGIDLDGNCIVDMYEFSEMAQNWLE